MSLNIIQQITEINKLIRKLMFFKLIRINKILKKNKIQKVFISFKIKSINSKIKLYFIFFPKILKNFNLQFNL